MHFSDKEEIGEFDSPDADVNTNSTSFGWRTDRKVTEETVTEIFDEDGRLLERRVVTVTRTEEVPNTEYVAPTPYRPYPYTVTWDATKPPYIMN